MGAVIVKIFVYPARTFIKTKMSAPASRAGGDCPLSFNGAAARFKVPVKSGEVIARHGEPGV